MKILYLSSDLGIPVLGYRGGSIHVRSLVEALTRAGHSVVLVSPLLTKSQWETPARLDVPVIQVEPSAATTSAWRSLRAFEVSIGATNGLPDEFRRILYNDDLATALRGRFRHDPPDVIYERCSTYGTAGASVARALGVPRLLELNAPMALEHSTYRGDSGLGAHAAAAERWAVSQADAVFVVSSALCEHAVSLGAPPERVHVLPNGVDAELFRPGPRDTAVRARWGLNSGPVLGFVGGHQPWHGLHVLPALLERLLPRHPDLRLVVVGDGRGREELAREIEARGLAANALLTGPVPHDEVPSLIREFDVAVAPYQQTDHDFYFSPLKLFEYMGCGAPIAAPRLGQIEEVVRDGETGLLYSPSDPDALAHACDRLLTDLDLGRRLGRAAAADVRRKYTWDHNAARVSKVAEALVAERGAAR